MADELAGEHINDLIDPYDDEKQEQSAAAEPALPINDDRDVHWYRKEVATRTPPANSRVSIVSYMPQIVFKKQQRKALQH